MEKRPEEGQFLNCSRNHRVYNPGENWLAAREGRSSENNWLLVHSRCSRLRLPSHSRYRLCRNYSFQPCDSPFGVGD